MYMYWRITRCPLVHREGAGGTAQVFIDWLIDLNMEEVLYAHACVADLYLVNPCPDVMCCYM